MLIDNIKKLAKKKNAIILAHYYQDPEIQDLADFIGDSLDLSRKVSNIDSDIILFCGVRFMAETAKILNPTKKVILPDLNASCSLAESCNPEEFELFCKQYNNSFVITYINSTAQIKAISDVICTSSNSENVVKSVPKEKQIIFAPDKYLGSYLQKKTGRDMVLWNGSCIVHDQFSEKHLVSLIHKHPEAHVIAHPECTDLLLYHADFIGSTASLIKYVKESDDDEFIILTEPSIIHQMKKVSPQSNFYPVNNINSNGSCDSCNKCPYMHMNNLTNIYECLLNEHPHIELSSEIIKKASDPLIKMLEINA